MNVKKFWIAVVVIFILLEILGYLVHGVILAATYETEGIKEIFRSMEEMDSKMWIMWLTDLIWVYFFVFFFTKGYENKGIMEGVRYGAYMGIFVSLVFSYQNYVMLPIPYSLALQWFIYSFIISLILGLTAALIYRPVAAAGSSES
jgi:hypothetical protein